MSLNIQVVFSFALKEKNMTELKKVVIFIITFVQSGWKASLTMHMSFTPIEGVEIFFWIKNYSQKESNMILFYDK